MENSIWTKRQNSRKLKSRICEKKVDFFFCMKSKVESRKRFFSFFAVFVLCFCTFLMFHVPCLFFLLFFFPFLFFSVLFFFFSVELLQGFWVSGFGKKGKK